MKKLGDRALDRLRRSADEPDLQGTKYRILGLLGRGGMGAVYIAEDVELDRKVALKVTANGSAPEELAARLRREARVIARLEHPSIVPVHDVGVLPDARVFYTMKLVRGRQLDVWLADDPPRPAVLRVFQRICEAVAFAHDNGVIHRDLKPQNVMVGEYGEALVMDWGLAKEAGVDAGLVSPAEGAEQIAPDVASADTIPVAGATKAGAVMGTPAFMSPEQARGATEAIDPRTDVFALGAILYFLLARHEPFRGASTAEVLAKVKDEDPPALEGVPRALASICKKALSKEPAQRYETAAAMADDIGSFLDSRPVSAHDESILERIGRVATKYRVILVLIAAYLAMRVLLLLVDRR